MWKFRAEGLEPVVVRSAATFGRNPGDDLIGIGNIASLAVDAIRGVDFQVRARAIRIVLHFINRGRTKMLAGVAVLSRATMIANIEVGNF